MTTMQVTLSRNDQGIPWGFRLQGGMDFQTPLSVQVVQPNSRAEQCGLHAGDGILTINNTNTDELTHEMAKMEIVRSGNQINMLIARGKVITWKPEITPLSQLRPDELTPIKSATGEEFVPVQKTSLVYNKPVQEPSKIGSSYNRSARGFGASPAQPKSATPNVTHSAYNTPIGLYSAGNIADSYATQTAGIQREMQNKDMSGHDAGTRVSGATMQPMGGQNQQGFGGGGAPAPRTQPMSATPNVTHSAYNTPIGLYSAGNIADSYATQTAGIQREMQNLDMSGHGAGTRMSGGTMQPMGGQNQDGFKSVKAPTAVPPSERPQQQPSMRCGGCDMLAQGVIVKAKGVPYHVNCFKCAGCGMNLKQKGYFVIEDKLHCETCAKKIAAPPGNDMVATAVYR